MNPLTTRAFDLPGRLAAKADPALIAADERHFAAIADTLEQSIADLTGRLEAELRAPGGIGQKAMDRDTEVHRLSARLRTLRRFGLDLCLGRMVGADDGAGGNPEPVYVGRLGLTDSAGRRLLVDWRSPVAEPFFGATHANPMGLASRRRYRWTGGRVSDYWDEVFTADGLEGHAALDDQSAFIASLGGNRSARMRDVLGTIAADQDAIIRAGSRGALVVDGGPGTGKTVVALHRCAYLLYADPRLGHRRGGVLFVGPHQPYLAYVADVLPSLGEEGVQTCTLRDLVPEGAAATPETDPEVARLKSSADLVKAIEAAVRFYENPPTSPMTVETPWSGIQLTAGRLGGGVRRGRARHRAQRGARGDLVRAGHDRGREPRGRRPGRPAAPVAAAEPGAAGGPQPGVAADRAGRPRLRPVDGPRLPAQMRPLAEPRGRAEAAAGRRPGLDGVRPAAARRGQAAAGRPGGGPPQAPPAGGRRRRARADGPGRRHPDRGRPTTSTAWAW